MIEEKRCTVCGALKAISEFYCFPVGSCRRRSACKECCRTRARAQYHEPGYKRLARLRVHARVSAMIAHFKSQPCADCGGTFPSCAMDFDHRPGTVKQMHLNHSGIGMRRLSDVLVEIEKCDVVCANCHRVRSTQRNQMGRKYFGDGASALTPRFFATLAKHQAKQAGASA